MSLADEKLLAPGIGGMYEKGRSFRWNLVSTRLTHFAYFNEILGKPRWEGKKILDLGGNVGTFLLAAGGRVDPQDYWCVDLNRPVVEQGRLTHPRAHFVHYDRYSPQYNPTGQRYLPLPDCGVAFDIILAFSVFTHIDRSEMVELVGSMRGMLAPGGVLACTFYDPYYDRSLSTRALPPGSEVIGKLESRGDGGSAQQQRQIDWCVLIDGDLHVDPGDELSHQTRDGKPLESYVSFFTSESMRTLFPEGTVHRPVPPDWQHCVVFQAPPATPAAESAR
jgi:SAM-dependent methyltransferase